jgi:hypothetical protein
MSRPATGRRLHTAAFDELLAIRGKRCADLARDTTLAESHISDMRAGRRTVTPPVAKLIATQLQLTSAEAILVPTNPPLPAAKGAT